MVVCVRVCMLTCAGVYRDTISPGIPPAHPWGGERIHVDAALMAPDGVSLPLPFHLFANRWAPSCAG